MNEKAGPVKHIHFSSRYLLSMSGGDNVEEKYCLSCKKAHAANPTKRVKLVLSDSTLHMFFAPPANAQHRADYEGDAIHTEYVTIPGARVEVLQQAFRIEYEVETRGIDVLLVAGLNNLLKGEKGEELMYKLCSFRDTVMRQSLKYHPDAPNTFAVATLLYAPQLCWFPDDGPVPSASYENRLEELQWINTELIKFNAMNGVVSVPHVHKFGIRVDNKSKRDMYGNVTVHHRLMHKWEQWREVERDRMVHLEEKKRVDLGRSINKYFKFGTRE